MSKLNDIDRERLEDDLSHLGGRYSRNRLSGKQLQEEVKKAEEYHVKKKKK